MPRSGTAFLHVQLHSRGSAVSIEVIGRRLHQWVIAGDRGWPCAFIPHPLLVILPFDISIRLNMPVPWAILRKMIKMHDHVISRRHRPASTQPVSNPGDHQFDFHVHPISPVAIPPPSHTTPPPPPPQERRAREGQVPPIPPFKANPCCPTRFTGHLNRCSRRVLLLDSRIETIKSS